MWLPHQAHRGGNSALGKRLDNVPKLPGIVPCEMLSATALEVIVVKMMVGGIIVILSTMMTILGGITRRWARGRDRYCDIPSTN